MEEGIEGVAAGEAVADPIARSTKAADDLYAFRDTYFPSDPVEKISALHQQANIALRILDDAFPLDQRKEPSQRASFEFLRGKILDVYPEYRKEAEDHLSKAVKLNPSLLDAWLCLGNCMWKKGDLSSARNCFSLALQKGPDKKILSQLSMLERRLAQGAENQCEMVDESIRHAKEAVMLDVRDGYSWCKAIHHLYEIIVISNTRDCGFFWTFVAGCSFPNCLQNVGMLSDLLYLGDFFRLLSK